MTDDKRSLEIIMEVQQQILLSDLDLKSFMQSVCDRMCELTHADGSTIEMLEGNEMVYASVSGTLTPHLGIRISKESSLSGRCLIEKKIMYSSDTEVDDLVNKDATRIIGARSMVCVPLFESSKSVGVLKVVSSSPDAFSSRDIESLQLLSIALGAELGKQLNYDEKLRVLKNYEELLAQYRSEIERRQLLENELILMAERDTLTGLLNRRGFSKRMQAWIQHGHDTDRLFGVLYLDLNKFKCCNDTYGHEIGDLVLKEFAGRIVQVVRDNDLVSRFGGDEFVLAVRAAHRNCLLQVAQRIVSQLEAPMVFGELTIPMATSIGCALWSPGQTETGLLRRADQSMYLAKSRGCNFIAFDSELVAAQKDRRPTPSLMSK